MVPDRLYTCGTQGTIHKETLIHVRVCVQGLFGPEAALLFAMLGAAECPQSLPIWWQPAIATSTLFLSERSIYPAETCSRIMAQHQSLEHPSSTSQFYCSIELIITFQLQSWQSRAGSQGLRRRNPKMIPKQVLGNFYRGASAV